MGTIKKKSMPKKWDHDKLTGQQIYHLIVGYSHFEPFPFENEEHQRALWFKFRDQLIRLNWEKHYSSDPSRGGWGTRPAAWWDYEAPELRQLIQGKYPSELLEHGYCFGAPRASGYGCEWESQEEYLDRLGLLTPEEKESLAQEENN